MRGIGGPSIRIGATRRPMAEIERGLAGVAFVAQALPVLPVIPVEILPAVDQGNDVVKLGGRAHAAGGGLGAVHAQGVQPEVIFPDTLQGAAADAIG
jgi:hypothetical protein